jgi:pyruvate,water dikinase
VGEQPHILPFEELRRTHVDVAGGKGANLGELLAAGIPVPPGFVVTTHAYRAFLDDTGVAGELRSALDSIDASDPGALDGAAARVRALITEASSKPACASLICDAYDRLGGALVAVRSSATAEDTEAASFAGQQSTFLNVEGHDSLLEAIVGCWASLFEARAIAYRTRAGISHHDVTIAVPVQRMVQSERSGVAFTVDPVTGDSGRMVIEAVRGLGEALVSGEVTPDMYTVDKASLGVVDRTHVEQAREYVYCASTSPPGRHSANGEIGANVWRELDAVKRRRPKLDDAEVAALAQIVMRVENHYGAPQDIEWAEAGGEFFILQARPITTLAGSH